MKEFDEVEEEFTGKYSTITHNPDAFILIAKKGRQCTTQSNGDVSEQARSLAVFLIRNPEVYKALIGIMEAIQNIVSASDLRNDL